jgi:hypothetical protein
VRWTRLLVSDQVQEHRVDADNRGQFNKLSDIETLRRLRNLAGDFPRGEFDRLNEDGSLTKIVSYQRHIDPLDRGGLALVREFRLRAAASCCREAFAPVCCRRHRPRAQADQSR